MRKLSLAFAELNAEQRDAVTHPGDTVVLAGPGSGKTDTLTVKVAHLIGAEIRAPRGLACLTYGREAVAEFAHRLAGFGVRSGRRTYLGTVHAFCIECVIRPLAVLVGHPELAARRVASKEESDRLRDLALNRFNLYPGVYGVQVTRVRRAYACGEPLDHFDHDLIAATKTYVEALKAGGLLDFEGMVLAALWLIERYELVRELLAARFEWLVVDEYQDLGGPLHRIVSALRLKAGIKVFAVGDPHQTIYDFTGANPRYLDELAQEPGVRVVRLRLNYRSGRRLINASQAVLALPAPLDYGTPPERKDPGELIIHDVPEGGIAAQLDRVIGEVIPSLRTHGVPLEQIALLYRGTGTVNLLRASTQALAAAGIPYNAERDDSFPRGPHVRWLQRAATWSLEWSAGRSDGASFADLAREYRRLGRAAGEDLDRAAGRHRRERLFAALARSVSGANAAGAWIVETAALLELVGLLNHIPTRRDDLDDLEALLGAAGGLPLTLGEFAADGRLSGRVVVTTYHSSKGRQFDAVILPAVQEGLVPARRWDWRRGQFDASPTQLLEDRRLFYVALTRARRWVHLLASPSYSTSKGVHVPLGGSRFVAEVRTRLNEE